MLVLYILLNENLQMKNEHIFMRLTGSQTSSMYSGIYVTFYFRVYALIIINGISNYGGHSKNISLPTGNLLQRQILKLCLLND